MIKHFKRAAELILNWILPRRARCMGCGSMLGCDRDDICDDCRERLAKNWVGVRNVDPKLRLSGSAFAHHYAGPAGRLVRNLKYLGVRVLAREMCADLSRAVELLRIDSVKLVTAVSMHPRRLRRRGANHAEILARGVAQNRGMEYHELLMRTRNAPQQARLSHERRAENLRGGFALRPEQRQRILGADVLLIDDVFTTGGTAAACAEALLEAGARRVYFAAYSYGERKN